MEVKFIKNIYKNLKIKKIDKQGKGQRVAMRVYDIKVTHIPSGIEVKKPKSGKGDIKTLEKCIKEIKTKIKNKK